MTNNCEFHVVLLIMKFVTVYEISQFNQSFKTVLSYKVSSEMFMCQCSKPWPHSDIRSCCQQSVCVFTSMYDSTLLDHLYYAESKVLQHEMVSYTCMCVYTHQLYYYILIITEVFCFFNLIRYLLDQQVCPVSYR